MSDHYYSPNPSSPHRPLIVEATLRGRTFRFVTDAGVFSRGGIDFGSRLLIETMDIPRGARVLDVGCGYGPIGICAAWLSGDGEATMIDVNERAVELAQENARRNGVRNAVALRSDRLRAVAGRQFDCVLTNPPIRAGKDVVYGIFEQALDVLVSGGALWVVIQKKQGAPSALAKLRQLYGESSVQEIDRKKGYWILKAVKP